MKSVQTISKNISVTKVIAFLSLTLLLPFLSSCDEKKENQSAPTVSHEQSAKSFSQQVSPQNKSPFKMTGSMVVTSVLNAGQYLYIEGEEKGTKTWIASNQLNVKPGDTLQYESGQVMESFYSKTFDRTFEEIIFTNLAMVMNNDGTVASSSMSKSTNNPQMANPHKDGFPTSHAKKAISVTKVEGGYTVEELYAKKDELKGQIVKVRGIAVKFLPGIMKRNWVHLQDGSGTKETNDLTITTQEYIKKGDTILCTGKLVINKDFGQGYAYALIMEDASITTE